jgi:outer membrane receptor protein involved in Fe transport
MMRNLLLISFLIMSGFAAVAQTALSGTMTDGDTKEPIIGGTVLLFRNGVQITGTVTDFDGTYSIANLDPGTYDAEASYLGYQSQRIEKVVIFAGKNNKLDFSLSQGVLLNTVEVKTYRVPLVEQDNTTQGQTITSEQIRALPTRNINALAATTAGLASADEGSAITVRGSRSDATNYYVDGIRVQGNLIPESEIDQMQVITGGVEAQYGDVTGGIISITTKGPSKQFAGGAEVETSKYLDPYSNSLAGINLTGPILKNKAGESILGYRLSGRWTQQVDDDPPGIPVYRVTDENLAALEQNPIISLSGNNFVAADFMRADDVNILKARPFEKRTQYDATAKIDLRVSKSVDLSFTGSYTDRENQFTPGGWRVYNSHNNPTSYSGTKRGLVRLRHRLGGDAKGSAIQNASYTLQFGFERQNFEDYDARHGKNLFAYGHVGNFDIDWVPTFGAVVDPGTGEVSFVHQDNRQVLRSFSAANSSNPVLSNYNNALPFLSGDATQLNVGIGNSIIGGDGLSDVIRREAFIAPNGFITSQFTSSWNFHTNVGAVYNRVLKQENDVVTFNANASFDLVPGGSSIKGRHSIQFGVWYEGRVNRSHSVAPRSLWDVARQLANSHILGIPTDQETGLPTSPVIGTTEITVGGQTVTANLHDVEIVENAEALFYRRLRQGLGISNLGQYINVDGLSPQQMSLSMFSAKELNDQQLLGYLGFDYLGNKFNGSFEDFFTAVDAEGIRTFPVAPNRPIYQAFYIQDKFTFRDIIFRLGLRVDRYDANTKVLKDNYSLYEIIGADEFHSRFGGNRPGNIGDDFKVYTAGTDSDNVQAYRNGDQWFLPNGSPVNNVALAIPSGVVTPRYKDDRIADNINFIRARDFDPNVSFRDYEVQTNFMPRLAFSFPISEDANFFAHYDVLAQRPPSNTIATALDYYYFFDRSGIRNNPNLKPERTIDYEVGFKQRLTNSSALTITAYYKEMRDMIQARVFFPVPIINQYETYDNIDFGTVKGFSFVYDQRRTGNFSMNANYTLQFADGTGSDANSQRSLTSRGNLRTLFPLNFDERHRIVLGADYRYDTGKRYTGPRLFGKDILAAAGVNFQAIAVSGRPYTRKFLPVELGGEGTIGSINGARKPWNMTVNIRVDKNINIGDDLSVNLYCRVSNLLDRRNIINVYPASGSAVDDGFLNSAFGQNQITTISNSFREVEAYLASYQWALLNPNNYSLPRRIFVGAIFDF